MRMAIIEKVEAADEDEDVRLHVRMSYEEFIALEGHMKGIHLFSEAASKHTTTISRRGPGSTRYILIPKALRKGIPQFIKDVPVTRLATASREFIIFTISKRILG